MRSPFLAIAKARTGSPRRSRAASQRRYRANQNAGNITPNVLITYRAQQALVRRAMRYGKLAPTDADHVSREWFAQEAADALEALADEWL